MDKFRVPRIAAVFALFLFLLCAFGQDGLEADIEVGDSLGSGPQIQNESQTKGTPASADGRGVGKWGAHFENAIAAKDIVGAEAAMDMMLDDIRTSIKKSKEQLEPAAIALLESAQSQAEGFRSNAAGEELTREQQSKWEQFAENAEMKAQAGVAIIERLRKEREESERFVNVLEKERALVIAALKLGEVPDLQSLLKDEEATK